MPEVGSLHPQIVHFVIALGVVGVLLRLVSITGFASWSSPAATALLLLAAGASVLAVKSGDEAHGPAERIPGARAVVHDHEEKGEWSRNLLLLVAAIELARLAVRKRRRPHQVALVASGLVGVAAVASLYRTGKAGGDIVYSYAGGVGMRAGDSAAVQRLLIAGLYHNARVARDAGRKEEAARLTDELARQVPGDPAVALLHASSLLHDRADAAGARAALASMTVPTDNPRLATQHGALTVESLAALGQADSARALLGSLLERYPGSRTLTELRDRMQQ